MDLLPQLSGILAVFALLGFTLWFLKTKGAIRTAAFLPFRWGARRARADERPLERIDGLQLSPTHSLSLIRMADRAILLGISPGGFCLIESSPWKPLQPRAEGAPMMSAQQLAGQSFAQRERAEQ